MLDENDIQKLVGYTCYYCKKYYGQNHFAEKPRVCYFDKSEAIEDKWDGWCLLCKNESEDYIPITAREVIEVYKR